MWVSVRFAGGLFGDDRTITLTDDEATVTDQGVVRLHRPIAGATVDEIRELARRVAALDAPGGPGGEPAVDGGTTTIEIRDGDRQRILVVGAGEERPDVVWALLDALEALAEGSR
jgi:hypothetical protein